MDNIEVTKNAALTPTAHEGPANDPLRSAIAQFCRRRSIEAATALSLIALTSFSQAWALSVSELKVESALGQPLRATLDINTNTGEFVNARCLRLSTPSDAGMPGVTGIKLAVSGRLGGATVRFTSAKPVREPMSEMTLNIDCSGTPALTKSFLVMLDPPALLAPAETTPYTPGAEPVSRPRAAARASRDQRQRSAARSAPSRSPISPGAQYVVQPGDILSVIASRVEGRPEYSVWPIAQRIYDTNPNAFDSRQPDSLRVGATLSIPALSGRLAVSGTIAQVREIRLRGARSATRATSATRAATRSATRTRRSTVAIAPPEPVATRREQAPRRATVAPVVANRQSVVRPMSYARDLSRLSMDRLRQRRAGKPFVVNFVTSEAPPVPVPVPQPVPEAAAPVVVKSQEPAAATLPAVAAPRRTGSWVIGGIALLLGALLGTLGTGLGLRRWLAAQKAEQEAEIARAKRHQARLDETRQARTKPASPTIVVHEELPRVDLTQPPTMDAIGSLDEVVAAGPSASAIGALLKKDAAAESLDEAFADVAADDLPQDEPVLSVDSLEPDADLDYDVFEAPDEEDLELLARDYASSETEVGELAPDVDFGETQALLTPEKLGMISGATEIMPNPLDLELPESNPDDTELDITALRKDFAPHDSADAPEAARDDVTESVISLDSNLLDLDLAQALPQDSDPTAESEVIVLDEGEQDNDPTTAIPTRDSEDFYHLEASSIRKVDSLSFEDEVDDEDTQLVSVRK